MRVSKKVSSLLMKVEMMFRTLDKETLIGKESLKNCLLRKAEEIMDKTNFPTCHEIQQKLVSKYLDVRIQIFCRRSNAKLKESSKKIGSDKGSRAMKMRKLVEKV